MPGYTSKPLWKKLGICENTTLVLRNSTGLAHPDYLAEIDFPVRMSESLPDRAEIIHLFVDRRKRLEEELSQALPVMARNGSLWISWPKKASRQPTDLTEDVIRAVILPLGLVDVKVCSVTDSLWSGLKLVIRRENR